MTATGQTPIPPAAAGSSRGVVTGNLMGILSMLVWAAGFPAAEMLLEVWDPVVVVTARFLSALAILLPLWIALDGWGALRLPGTGAGMVVGGIGFGGGAFLILLAQWHTDPVTVAVITAASPMTATLVEWVYLRTALRRPFLAGLVLTVIGGVVATGAAPGNLGLGAALALLSTLLFSWASFLTMRRLPDHSVLGRTTVTLLGGLVVLCLALAVMTLAGMSTFPPTPVGLREIGLVLVYGLLALALSQLWWIGSVERLGVALASFHINVAPFYVMLLMLAFGGTWSWPQAIGGLIVVAGVVIAQTKF